MVAPHITSAAVQRHVAVLDLSDGRSMVVPLPEMVRDAPKQLRRHWVVVGGGAAIHWPGIGEDLALEEALKTPPPSKNPIPRPTYEAVRNAMSRAQIQAWKDWKAREHEPRALRIPDLYCAWRRLERLEKDFEKLAARSPRHRTSW